MNLPVLFSIFFGLVLFIGYSYISILMVKESTRPRDWLTPLRYRILAAMVLTVLTIVPSLIFQILRYYGIESGELRNIVTITSRVGGLLNLFLLYSIFTYKRKDK